MGFFKLNFKVGNIFFLFLPKIKPFGKHSLIQCKYINVRNLEVLFYVGVIAVCILQCAINIMDSSAEMKKKT